MRPMDAPSLTDLVPIDGIWRRMDEVERRLFEVTTTSNRFLTEIAQHLVRAGGKRYRPLLAQVAAELGPNPDGGGPVEAGTAAELVHIGSLYHDDVIDEAETRRGSPSVNANWDNTAAILGGDYLLAKASEVAAPLGEEAVTLIAQTYAALCEGQVLELQLEGNFAHGPAEYFTVIGGKTASLIRTSARLGALTAGAARDDVEAISEWAWEVGIVFQMADDVLDLVASEDFIGKPAGSDLREGTYTLPVLYALQGPEGDEIRPLLSDGAPSDTRDVDRIIELTAAGGHVDRVLNEANERLRVAEKAAARLPESGLRPILRSLELFLTDRVHAARG